uniref:Uncharacterized protein n=1 Tax=Mustela putorius furo TaxID=9669 RepID=M3XTP3_MUSPF
RAPRGRSAAGGLAVHLRKTRGSRQGRREKGGNGRWSDCRAQPPASSSGRTNSCPQLLLSVGWSFLNAEADVKNQLSSSETFHHCFEMNGRMTFEPFCS